MNKLGLIEIFPRVNASTSECDPMSGEECCDELVTVNEGDALKEQLVSYYNDNLDVLVYDYSVPMDRIMAQKKLKPLLAEVGYSSIKGAHILQYATPAIVVNGKLLSFATEPNIDDVIGKLIS